MANPYGEPTMEPGNPDRLQPCQVYAAGDAPEEHDMSHVVSFGDPHPIRLVCSCNRQFQVVPL